MMRLSATIVLVGFLGLGCAGHQEGEASLEESFADEAINEGEGSGATLPLPDNFPFPNSSGISATVSTEGSVDLENEFFQDFGTNGRTCGACHLPGDGWGISALAVRQLFDSTDGTAPIFRLVDGSNSPLADVSTAEARRASYSMLLGRGVFRIGIGIPPTAEFDLVSADDPYGFAHAGELSLFRRPLPSTNLCFIPSVMWDGRETTGATIEERLAVQSNSATARHSEAAAPLTEATRLAIVDFESSLSTAQMRDAVAGRLDAGGARGGPQELADMGLADSRWDLFDAWIGIEDDGQTDPEVLARRAAIARGQELFNAFNAGAGGSCRECHNVSNVGSSATPLFVSIGTSSGSRRTPDLPLYTLRNKTTGRVVTTTDPGRALITGRWIDIGAFKVPVLRGLAARAPYFHDGSASTLMDVVALYEEELRFAFTPEEEADLVAFLTSL